MAENPFFKSYLWKDPDHHWLRKVLDHIEDTNPKNNETILLKCEDIDSFDDALPLLLHLFSALVELDSFKGERIMFMNLKDLLLAIELCLKQEKKIESFVEPDLSDLDILDYFHQYRKSAENEMLEDSKLQNFMKESNCIDSWILLNKFLSSRNQDKIQSLFHQHTYLILGTPNSKIMKKLLQTVCGEEVQCVRVETPLNVSMPGSPNSAASESVSVVSECVSIDSIDLNPLPDSSVGSATEEYIEEIILAFLSLLLNSRNELALCKAMTSPIIELSHQAFTALKHLSVEKELPMCQVAISYVTRIRLGGKGYAPAKDCPLLPHLKGLECFVDILNQMQMITEEDSKPESAIKRLINILKKKLLKSKSTEIKDSSIEAVATNLLNSLSLAQKHMKSPVSENTTQINQAVLDVLYYFVNFMTCSNFIHDSESAFKRKNIKRTPLNLPPLLGYFRSPEEESSLDTRSSFHEESTMSTISVVAPLAPLAHSSYFHHSDSSSITAASCFNSSTPSRTSFKDCLDKKETDAAKSIASNENPAVAAPTKRRSGKRCILAEITNEVVESKAENDPKNAAKKPCKIVDVKKSNKVAKPNPKKETKKTGKAFKQIQGQGKITSFFIVGKS